MLIRLIVSCVVLERRKARAVPGSRNAWQRVAGRGCGSTRKGVRIACSTEIATPMVAGLRRPSILFPSRLLGQLEEAELDQIGLHEAAHLARGDDYALIFERFLEALFAWHPVVRWIARRIDLEREIACDDLVVAATGQPRPYAACLTRVVELAGGVRISPAGAAAADETSHLSIRVEALLDKTTHKGTHVLTARLTAVVAALAALSSLATRAPRLVAFAPPLSPLLVQLFTPPVPAVAQPQAPPAPPVVPRPDKPMVLIPVNVVDPWNRFVTRLEKQIFRLFEDGVEQEIVQFSSEDAAISVCIVFDTSGSMGRALGASRDSVGRFMKTASAYLTNSFAHPVQRRQASGVLVQDFTANPQDIQDGLALIQSRGRTALLDAVYLALFQRKKAHNPRKAILIVSDGDDNGSRYLEHEIAIIVREAGVPIYAIGVTNTRGSALLDQDHQAASGGRHVPVDSPPQLCQDAAARIALELRNQYVLGYIRQNATGDGQRPTVKVQLAQPRGPPPLRAFFPIYAPAQ